MVGAEAAVERGAGDEATPMLADERWTREVGRGRRLRGQVEQDLPDDVVIVHWECQRAATAAHCDRAKVSE